MCAAGFYNYPECLCKSEWRKGLIYIIISNCSFDTIQPVIAMHMVRRASLVTRMVVSGKQDLNIVVIVEV